MSVFYFDAQDGFVTVNGALAENCFVTEKAFAVGYFKDGCEPVFARIPSRPQTGIRDIEICDLGNANYLLSFSPSSVSCIETQTLVIKILGNVVSYGALSSAIIGEQQRLDDLIKVATTQAQLDAIVWTLNPLEA